MTNKKIIVVKFGGNALTETSGKSFCRCIAEVAAKGFAPIIVHGGGPQINELLAALDIKSHFVNGLRYTDKATLAAAEMALSGKVNKMLVQFLGDENTLAAGISGKDGKLLVAEKMTKDNDGNSIDLGYVGNITAVNPTILHTLIDKDFIPVIAPLAYGSDGQTYNINADYAAAAIAKSVSAANFIMMTNIDGLLDANGKIIHHTNSNTIKQLIEEGIIQGGMIPKTLSAIDTLATVGQVNIIDGRNPDNLLAVLSEQPVGTTISG